MKTAWFIFTFWTTPYVQEPPWLFGYIPSRPSATVPLVNNLYHQYDSQEECMADIPLVIARGEVKDIGSKSAAFVCIEAMIP